MSLFVCFTLTPWLASRFAKETVLKKSNPIHRFLMWFERRIDIFTNQYVKLVGWSLKHKIITAVSILGLFVISFAVMGLGIVGQEFVAQGDQGKFMIKLKYDKSTPFAENNAITLDIEKMILAQKDVKMVFSNVGGPSSGMGAASFGNESRSELTVKLKDHVQDRIPTAVYMSEIRKKIEQKHSGIEVKAINIGMVESEEAPIEIFLSSNDTDLLMKEARRLKEAILVMPGAKDPTVSTDDITPEIRIELDREKMGQLGLPIAVVGMQLQNALTGNTQSNYTEKDNEYEIRVMMDQSDRQNIRDIKNMSFTTTKGNVVELEEFAEITMGNGFASLERKNRLSSTTVRALSKLEILSDYNIHSIEQPIQQGQWIEMKRLCEETKLPIALDEELIGVTDNYKKRELLEVIKPQFIILKPSLHGGINGCKEWIELADSFSIPWWITSALESNVGLSAIAQFTGEYTNLLPQGLGTGSLYTNNVPSNLRIEKGELFLLK
jgi:HAE1 family hydrophobic/amphiphilic exporter-1